MSQSSLHHHQTEQPQVCEDGGGKKKKREWVEELIRWRFFEACEIHPIRKNERNRYCINCNIAACQYCISCPRHRNHEILKIYRHVYNDVVSVSAMENHIDCSYIQPYKCNKQYVISLNPLPHTASASASNSNTGVGGGGVCDVCGRRLGQPHLYHYCSISCKVFHDQDDAFHNKNLDPQEEEKPKRKRKGTPTRAPFF